MLAINAHNVPDRDNQTLDVYDVVYEVVYRVEDHSGVSRTAVFKNDVRRDVDRFDGPTDTGSHDSAFVFESYTQYLAEVYFAPQASVKAVDVHGNADRITKRDAGLYARLAELVPKLPGTLRLAKQAFPVTLTPVEMVGLLAGFSFAVGQSVNDVITLIRNPDQLKAFVDLAKAIYERPEILPALVEAFVGTFQRFQNVQNPFPGPQNLLNPTNPDSFTNDNSTFGRTWFGGYGLAFVALGVVTGGASAAGLTALEGISATAANAIRLVINAPSLLASRAVGLLGRSALRVAVRVGRATELRVSAVKRAVDGLPTPRLHAVRRDVLRTDGGHVAEIAEAGLSREAAEYLVRTGRHRGRVLLNELSPEQALQLLDADDAIQNPLVAAWRRSDAVDAETVRDVVDVADELDDSRTAQLADLLDQDGAARMVGEEGVDATTMRRILDDDAGEAAVDLHDDLGVSGRRIDELVEEGVDLDRVSTLLGNRYDGTWSPGRFGNRNKNFDEHYNKHVVNQNEWGTDASGNPTLSKSEYRRRARELANERSDVGIFYQKGNENMIVYDEAANELVVVNARGEIQTLFRPTQGKQYVLDLLQNGQAIQVKG